MIGFVGNIEDLTESNSNFRQVIYTGKHAQLVVMCLGANEDIGEETHEAVDQFIRVEQGSGKLVMNGEEYLMEDDFAVVVPAGVVHNIINTSPDTPLKLYTLYSPPHHKDGVIHKTKQEAQDDVSDIFEPQT